MEVYVRLVRIGIPAKVAFVAPLTIPGGAGITPDPDILVGVGIQGCRRIYSFDGLRMVPLEVAE